MTTSPNEHPAAGARPFAPERAATARGHGRAHAIRDGFHLAIAATADHADEIRIAGPAAHVEQHRLDRLLIEGRRDDELGEGQRIPPGAFVPWAQF
jgi:hypothetical protein